MTMTMTMAIERVPRLLAKHSHVKGVDDGAYTNTSKMVCRNCEGVDSRMSYGEGRKSEGGS